MIRLLSLFSLTRLWPIALAGLWCGGGCSSAVHDAGDAAGQGAASGLLTGMDHPAGQQRLAEVARSAGAQEASQAVGVGLGRGIVDGVVTVAGAATTPARTSTPAGDAASGYNDPAPAASQPAALASSALPGQADTTLFARLAPGLSQLVRMSVRGGLSEASDPQAQQSERALAQAVGQGTTSGIGDAIARGDLDPAIRRLGQAILSGALGDAAKQQVRDLGQAVGAGAAHGVIDTLDHDGRPLLQTPDAQRLGAAVDQVMADHVRPALRDFFRQDIAPTVVDILKESAANSLKVSTRQDTQAAVVQDAINVSRGATFGTHQAAIDLGLLQPSGGLSVAVRIALWIGAALIVLMILLAIGFLIVLARLAASFRRLKPT